MSAMQPTGGPAVLLDSSGSPATGGTEMHRKLAAIAAAAAVGLVATTAIAAPPSSKGGTSFNAGGGTSFNAGGGTSFNAGGNFHPSAPTANFHASAPTMNSPAIHNNVAGPNTALGPQRFNGNWKQSWNGGGNGNWRFRHHHHHGFVGFGLYAYGPDYYDYGSSCYERRLVRTPVGWRWRLVWVCY
jgi:hypothetical protein